MKLVVAEKSTRPVPIVELGDGRTRRRRATARVALVNMPCAMADRPSIQCGLLKAVLTASGHDVDVHYLNLEFAAEFGANFYHELSFLRTHLLIGEWLFAVAAFGHRGDEEEYRKARPSVEAFCREDIGVDFKRLCEYRNEVIPSWIRRWSGMVDWGAYAAVGFTSTFEQNTPSFSLARAIKERYPALPIIFGGANFDGDMGKEYVRALPFIDYAVVGEGERAFPAMVEHLAIGANPLGVPGVIGRVNDSVAGTDPGPRIHDMDRLPDPNYDDFYDTLFRLGTEEVLADRQSPILLIETSRGCWWGQKKHCTFCGLNATGMQYRAKTPEAALGQIRRLSKRYKITNFEAVDNILDYRYLKELCGPLGEKHYDYRFFYEVKANLKREQLRTMARAGIKVIQPGIESLNSHILALMRKGISMLHNVRCIKWGTYYQMRVLWNILTGFPGETEDDYQEQIRIIPLLRHLPPPAGCGRIWLERFSPYFFDDSFPVHNVRPLEAYRFIYPEDKLNLSEIAYFFDYDMGETLPDSGYEELQRAVKEWKKAWEGKRRPQLVYQRAPDWIQIFDRRTDEVVAHSFEGVAAAVYESCGDTDRNATQICNQLDLAAGKPIDPAAVGEALNRFCELGLMLEEDGAYLSLALPVNSHW